MRLSTYFVLLLIGVLAAAFAHADAGNYSRRRPGVSAPYPQPAPQGNSDYDYYDQGDGQMPPDDACVRRDCGPDSGPVYRPRAAGNACTVVMVGPGYAQILDPRGIPLIAPVPALDVERYLIHYRSLGFCPEVLR